MGQVRAAYLGMFALLRFCLCCWPYLAVRVLSMLLSQWLIAGLVPMPRRRQVNPPSTRPGTNTVSKGGRGNRARGRGEGTPPASRPPAAVSFEDTDGERGAATKTKP